MHSTVGQGTACATNGKRGTSMEANETSMQSLLSADEERVQNTLKANQSVDRSRDLSIQTLDDELSALLLRYNASCVGRRRRQGEADAMTAVVRDSLGFLKASEAVLEKGPARRRVGAPYLLVLAALLCGPVVLTVKTQPVVAYVCLAAAVLCAFLSGLLWVKAGEGQAVSTLDPDGLWHTLARISETMDRKLEDLAALPAENASPDPAETISSPLSPDELALVTELLEALYTDNGDFALQRLKKLRPYLREKGIELLEFESDTEEYFEILPSKQSTATLRPALLYHGDLLMIGRAARPEKG